MALSDKELAMLYYLQNAYPVGIRGDATTDGTTINYYDKVRAITLAYFKDNIEDGMKQLVVQTATETGVLEWENFLGLPIDTSKSIAVRKAAIISKLVGSVPTLSTIKSILQTLVQPYAEGVSIRELFETSPDPEDVFTYEVRIYAPIEGDYDTADIQEILEAVHPAHCNVLMVIIPPIADALEVTDTVDNVKHVPFDWAEETAGAGPDDGNWTDESPFFQAGYAWTDDSSYYPVVK